MWIVTKTPSRYRPTGWPEYCILDDEDGDLHSFYKTKEEAEEALRLLLMGIKK
jgi:hypothetical protein